LDGSVLTGGEPLLQADFLAELLVREELPRPRLLETNGMLPERLALVLPQVDIVSMDMKIPSNTDEPAFWQEHARFLALARGKVYVKILIDAGTAITDVERAADLMRSIAAETPVFLQPIAGRQGAYDVEPNALTAFYRASRRFLDDIRVLPQVHRILGVQ
jgi:organic radical activating enzyme